MAAEACKELPAAKALFEQASDILGYDLLDLCTNGPKEKLDATEFAQPALFVAGLAAVEKLKASDEAEVKMGFACEWCWQLPCNDDGSRHAVVLATAIQQ